MTPNKSAERLRTFAQGALVREGNAAAKDFPLLDRIEGAELLPRT
jgi:hypothetical protein